MFLCILVYVFLDNQQEDEVPGGGQPEFREFNLILISSFFFFLQFGFVKAIPKFLNIATFSEGLLANYKFVDCILNSTPQTCGRLE